jgi:hypothetical protein
VPAPDELPKLRQSRSRSLDPSTDWLNVRISNSRSGEFFMNRLLADNNVLCQLLRIIEDAATTGLISDANAIVRLSRRAVRIGRSS